MIYLISAMAGLSLGSFANVCIRRLPREESLALPASHCPRCRKPLRPIDNIPLLSFILLKGRCFYCKRPISWQYPLVEFTMAVLFLFSAWKFQTSMYRIVLFDIWIFYLLTISIIDYHHKIIPDELSLSLLCLGALVSFRNPYLMGHALSPFVESVLAAATGGAVMMFFAWGGERLFKKEALGGGDVKLIAAFGSNLGWTGLVGSLVIGSFVGALVGGALLLSKRKKAGDAIPYGPFLCLGAFFSCLYPTWLNPFLSP